MGEEFMFAEPLRGPPTKLQKLHAWIAKHKYARLIEFLFWGVPGALVLVFAWWSDRVMDWTSDPIAMLIGLVGVSLIVFGMLPPVKPREAPKQAHPKSLRVSKRAK